MTLKDFFMNPDVRWSNIFLRDIFLVGVMAIVVYRMGFISWISFVCGMLLVWITWHFSDYLKYKRSLRLCQDGTD